LRSSSNYGEAARSQLEMEEQCQNAPRATHFRASLRAAAAIGSLIVDQLEACGIGG